jgi:hypothetical protein
VPTIGKPWAKQKAEEVDVRTGVSDLGDLIATKIGGERDGVGEVIGEAGAAAMEIETGLARRVWVDVSVGVAEKNFRSLVLRNSSRASEEKQPNGANTLCHLEVHALHEADL